MQNLKSFNEFLENINKVYDSSRFYVNNEYVYYLPELAVIDKSVHYIRTGLLMGRIRNDRFEPSQALAMQLKAEDWKDPLLLSVGDPRVMKYLKGETVELIEGENKADGYRLLCLNGHPLGWVKQSGMKCKNKYYPGWRYN